MDKLIYSVHTVLVSKYIQAMINCLSKPNKFTEYKNFDKYTSIIKIVYQFESSGNPKISKPISNSIL